LGIVANALTLPLGAGGRPAQTHDAGGHDCPRASVVVTATMAVAHIKQQQSSHVRERRICMGIKLPWLVRRMASSLPQTSSVDRLMVAVTLEMHSLSHRGIAGRDW